MQSNLYKSKLTNQITLSFIELQHLHDEVYCSDSSHNQIVEDHNCNHIHKWNPNSASVTILFTTPNNMLANLYSKEPVYIDLDRSFMNLIDHCLHQLSPYTILWQGHYHQGTLHYILWQRHCLINAHRTPCYDRDIIPTRHTALRPFMADIEQWTLTIHHFMTGTSHQDTLHYTIVWQTISHQCSSTPYTILWQGHHPIKAHCTTPVYGRDSVSSTLIVHHYMIGTSSHQGTLHYTIL